MTVTDNTKLITDLRRKGERALSSNLQRLLDRAADAIEAAEQRANAAEREMHARELHHFEAEEGLAAAQAVIAEAKDHYDPYAYDGSDAELMYAALTQSPTDALEAHDQQVAAKALTDAADEFESGLEYEDLKHRTEQAPKGWTDESINDAIQGSGPIMDWLRARAASIEGEKP